MMNSKNVHPVLLELLHKRNIKGDDAIRRFLAPTMADIAVPDCPDLERAAEVIGQAVAGKRHILICGDYDADGITAAALLKKALDRMGARVSVFLPSRFEGGFGLSQETVDYARDQQVDLVITVDNGISSIHETAAMKQLGLQVVVTDHHEPGPDLPEADVLVDPKLGGWQPGDENLAGVGVVFKLLQVLRRKGVISAFPKDMLELVAVGTVCDVVPLTGENRVLVKLGLQRLQFPHNRGLRALMDVAGVKEVTAYTIGFILGPRLNAAGRLDHPDKAFRLLTDGDDAALARYAGELDALNAQRRQEEEDAWQRCLSRVRFGRQPILLYADDEAGEGIIGLLASRLSRRFHRPALVVTTTCTPAKASGRNIAGVNILQHLSRAAHLLRSYGGHEMACGFSIDEENLPALAQFYREYTLNLPARDVAWDMKLPITDVSRNLIDALDLLRPYGAGNRKPLFMSGAMILDSARVVGGKHLKLAFRTPAGIVGAMCWRKGEHVQAFQPGECYQATYFPYINTFRGEHMELEIRHIQPAEDVTMPMAAEDTAAWPGKSN